MNLLGTRLLNKLRSQKKKTVAFFPCFFFSLFYSFSLRSCRFSPFSASWVAASFVRAVHSTHKRRESATGGGGEGHFWSMWTNLLVWWITFPFQHYTAASLLRSKAQVSFLPPFFHTWSGWTGRYGRYRSVQHKRVDSIATQQIQWMRAQVDGINKKRVTSRKHSFTDRTCTTATVNVSHDLTLDELIGREENLFSVSLIERAK